MTKKQTDVKPKETNPKQKDSYIYCGPNLGMKLPTFTILLGNNPKILEKELKECKSIEKLIVPVKEFPEIKENILIVGTKENIYYRDILEYLKGSDK